MWIHRFNEREPDVSASQQDGPLLEVKSAGKGKDKPKGPSDEALKIVIARFPSGRIFQVSFCLCLDKFVNLLKLHDFNMFVFISGALILFYSSSVIVVYLSKTLEFTLVNV